MEGEKVDFFAVRGAKKLLKAFPTSTLTQLWRVGLTSTHDSTAPTRRSDLIAGLRKVIEQAGHRHLTHLPPVDLLRSIAITLAVPLTSGTPKKIECQKRITEYLDDNGVEYMLDRLDDGQLTAICEALGMALVVAEGETLNRQGRAGLHAFVSSLAPALIEQLAADLGVDLTEDGGKKRKKDLLINDILTKREASHSSSSSSSSSSSTSANYPTAATETKKKPKNKSKRKEKETDGKPEAKEDGNKRTKGSETKKAKAAKERDEKEEDSDLDLDDLARYPMSKLRKYCDDEQLVVKTRTKAAYIEAIVQHNDKLELQEKEEQRKKHEAVATNTSSVAGASDDKAQPDKKRFKMLALVKSETPMKNVRTVTASDTPTRQGAPMLTSATGQPPIDQAVAPRTSSKKPREEPQVAGNTEMATDKNQREPKESTPIGDPAVCDVLSSIGLAECIPLFASEKVDMDALLLLENAHLVEMGLKIGQRAKLVNKIKFLREGASTSNGTKTGGAGASTPDKDETQAEDDTPSSRGARSTSATKAKGKKGNRRAKNNVAGEKKTTPEEMEEEEQEEEVKEKEEEGHEATKPPAPAEQQKKKRRRLSEVQQLDRENRIKDRREEVRKRRKSYTPVQTPPMLLGAGHEGGDDQEVKGGGEPALKMRKVADEEDKGTSVPPVKQGSVMGVEATVDVKKEEVVLIDLIS